MDPKPLPDEHPNKEAHSAPSLAKIFFSLRFASAADSFLAKCCPDNLSWQLSSRRISHITIVPLLSSGGLGIGDDGEFFVMINHQLSSDEQAQALGHEIGHTFHHNLTKMENILPESVHDDAERFCRAFADLWVEKNGLRNIIARLRKEAQLITSGRATQTE